MNKVSKGLGYLIYIIVFILLIISITYLENYLKTQAGRYLGKYIYINIFFMTAYPIGLGLLVGLPSFLRKIKRKGVWQINWLRLIIVGTPALFFATLYIFYYLQPFGIRFPAVIPFFIHLVQPTVITVNGIMFGYTLISSINKE